MKVSDGLVKGEVSFDRWNWLLHSQAGTVLPGFHVEMSVDSDIYNRRRLILHGLEGR